MNRMPDSITAQYLLRAATLPAAAYADNESAIGWRAWGLVLPKVCIIVEGVDRVPAVVTAKTCEAPPVVGRFSTRNVY